MSLRGACRLQPWVQVWGRVCAPPSPLGLAGRCAALPTSQLPPRPHPCPSCRSVAGGAPAREAQGPATSANHFAPLSFHKQRSVGCGLRKVHPCAHSKAHNPNTGNEKMGRGAGQSARGEWGEGEAGEWVAKGRRAPKKKQEERRKKVKHRRQTFDPSHPAPHTHTHTALRVCTWEGAAAQLQGAPLQPPPYTCSVAPVSSTSTLSPTAGAPTSSPPTTAPVPSSMVMACITQRPGGVDRAHRAGKHRQPKTPSHQHQCTHTHTHTHTQRTGIPGIHTEPHPPCIHCCATVHSPCARGRQRVAAGPRGAAWRAS